MVRQFIVLIFTVIGLLACTKKETTVKKTKVFEGKKVIAYVTSANDNWGQNNEKANQITHINYAFANIKNGVVVEGTLNDEENLQKLN